MADEETTHLTDHDATAVRRIRRATPQGAEEIEDALAVERRLRFTLNGREVAAVMCSPGHEDELGVGLALTQGLIRSAADLLSVGLRGDAEKGDAVRIVVPVELSLSVAGRVTARGTAGGVVQLEEELPVLEGDGPSVTSKALLRMAQGLSAGQTIYARTGGTHGAGVFRVDGGLIALREDVGRHNAVDKAIGHCLLAGESLADKVLVISGRASREMVTKAARGGVPILASVSAATDAGVDVAERCRLTLVGFLRDERMNVYTCPHRIAAADR